MKKTLFAFLITILLFTFAGCRDNIKTCAGKIKNMTDTTIVANMGDYDITFDIKKLRCQMELLCQTTRF